jgi:hypothetical protein
MTDEQFERLLKAIDRNTEAQIVVGQTIIRLADETVTLATLIADPDGEAGTGRDMAGRPIETN